METPSDARRQARPLLLRVHLGGTYEWWYEGALEEQVLASFAISVLWDTTGFVCVQETNQEGCIGEPVCLDVFVQDDVWSVSDLDPMAGLSLFPNLTDFLQVEVSPQLLGRPFQILDAVGKTVWNGSFEEASTAWMCKPSLQDNISWFLTQVHPPPSKFNGKGFQVSGNALKRRRRPGFIS